MDGVVRRKGVDSQRAWVSGSMTEEREAGKEGVRREKKRAREGVRRRECGWKWIEG